MRSGRCDLKFKGLVQECLFRGGPFFRFWSFLVDFGESRPFSGPILTLFLIFPLRTHVK